MEQLLLGNCGVSYITVRQRVRGKCGKSETRGPAVVPERSEGTTTARGFLISRISRWTRCLTCLDHSARARLAGRGGNYGAIFEIGHFQACYSSLPHVYRIGCSRVTFRNIEARVTCTRDRSRTRVALTQHVPRPRPYHAHLMLSIIFSYKYILSTAAQCTWACGTDLVVNICRSSCEVCKLLSENLVKMYTCQNRRKIQCFPVRVVGKYCVSMLKLQGNCTGVHVCW